MMMIHEPHTAGLEATALADSMAAYYIKLAVLVQNSHGSLVKTTDVREFEHCGDPR